jgi:hypothetical protein
VRGRAFPIAIAALAAACPALAGDPPADAPPGRDAAFQARVDAAIDRGVAWLRERQAEDGHFPGPYDRGEIAGVRGIPAVNTSHIGQTALALYALRSCGVPFEDPQVARGFAWLRRRWDSLKGGPGADNYGVSLTLLALEAHHAPPVEEETGGDRYGRPTRRKVPVPEPDLSWIRELAAWLVRAQGGDGGFGYRSPSEGYHDHSNTQFSLLALKAARRCGVVLPVDVWEKALRHLLGVQEREGPEVLRKEAKEGGGDAYGTTTRAVARDRARGWGYRDGDPATGSMTSGGVSSLVICRSELLGTRGYGRALDAKAEKGIWDGLAWLGRNFSVSENPGPADAPMAAKTWQYYWLYGVERAGVLSGVTLMAGRDWYLEGADYLVGRQSKAGGWSGVRRIPADVPLPPDVEKELGRFGIASGGDLLDTCFALLFLKKATFRVRRGGVATAPAGEGLDLSGAASLEEGPFRDLFDAVFRRYAGAEGQGREALAGDFVRLGTRSIPLLVMRLEDPDPGRRAAAIAALERTTGATRGFDPAAPAEARTAAVAAWEEWWFRARGRLVADVGSATFRDG